MRWTGAALALLLLLITISPASAHANLERSSPAAGAVVVDQPKQVQLWFSEDPEIGLTELRLLDPTGRQVGTLTARPVPGDTRSVVATLPDLAPGTHVIAWRATSAIDGHTTAGAFPFTYGAGQVPVAVSLAGESAVPTYAPSPLDMLGRFLTFGGAYALVGGLAFGPLVLWPLLSAGPFSPWEKARMRASRGGRGGRPRPSPGTPSPPPSPRGRGSVGSGSLEAAAARTLGWTAGLALVALALGSGLSALAQAASAAGVSPLQALGDPLTRALGGTRLGYLLGARAILALLLAVLVPPVVLGLRAVQWVALLIAGALLLTLSMGAHAAAVPWLTGAMITVDWLHVAAGAIWVGGLLQLGLLLDDARGDLTPGLISRFSVMVWAVGAVSLTGLVEALVQVGAFGPLVETGYGQTLIVKIVLVALMAALGFVHWRLVGPRLRERALDRIAARIAAFLKTLHERYRVTVRAEAMLGIGVLAATAVLTAQQPAKDAAYANRAVVVSGQADDLSLTLRVAPGEAGLNKTELRVSPVPQNVEKVVLRLSHLEMDMGEQEIPMQETAPGDYTADGGQFSMPGRWQAEPLIRRTGREDARVKLVVPVGYPPAAAQPGGDQPPITITPRAIVGIEAIIFGAILLVAAIGLSRRDGRVALASSLTGLVAVLVGGYISVTAVAAEAASPQRLRSPIEVDAAALARGRQVYQENCVPCHGLAGRGDGPLGRTLPSRPADLRVHAMAHTEGELFTWISDGVAGTPMPSFKDRISVEDRWKLVAFIKGFSEEGPGPAQTAVAQMVRGQPANQIPQPTAAP